MSESHLLGHSLCRALHCARMGTQFRHRAGESANQGIEGFHCNCLTHDAFFTYSFRRFVFPFFFRPSAKATQATNDATRQRQRPAASQCQAFVLVAISAIRTSRDWPEVPRSLPIGLVPGWNGPCVAAARAQNLRNLRNRPLGRSRGVTQRLSGDATPQPTPVPPRPPAARPLVIFFPGTPFHANDLTFDS